MFKWTAVIAGMFVLTLASQAQSSQQLINSTESKIERLNDEKSAAAEKLFAARTALDPLLLQRAELNQAEELGRKRLKTGYEAGFENSIGDVPANDFGRWRSVNDNECALTQFSTQSDKTRSKLELVIELSYKPKVSAVLFGRRRNFEAHLTENDRARIQWDKNRPPSRIRRFQSDRQRQQTRDSSHAALGAFEVINENGYFAPNGNYEVIFPYTTGNFQKLVFRHDLSTLESVAEDTTVAELLSSPELNFKIHTNRGLESHQFLSRGFENAAAAISAACSGKYNQPSAIEVALSSLRAQRLALGRSSSEILLQKVPGLRKQLNAEIAPLQTNLDRAAAEVATIDEELAREEAELASLQTLLTGEMVAEAQRRERDAIVAINAQRLPHNKSWKLMTWAGAVSLMRTSLQHPISRP